MAYKPTEERVVGDTWDFPLTITQIDEDGVSGPYTGLSASTITCTIRHRDTGAQLWQGTKAGGQVTVTDDPNGEILVRVPSADTDEFEERLYNADVQVTSGAVTVTPIRFYLQALKDYTVP